MAITFGEWAREGIPILRDLLEDLEAHVAEEEAAGGPAEAAGDPPPPPPAALPATAYLVEQPGPGEWSEPIEIGEDAATVASLVALQAWRAQHVVTWDGAGWAPRLRTDGEQLAAGTLVRLSEGV